MKKQYKETETHIYFWGSEFSNFYPITFKYRGYEFANTEQAFMWEKALHFKDFNTANLILKTTNPQEAKGLGRKVKNFDSKEWLKVCEDFMYKVNLEKWLLMPELLLSTCTKVIVEASPVDTIWGVGLSKEDPLILDEKNWKGLNLLGKVLMKVRKDLEEML